MASVFKKDEVVEEKSVIEIIRESLDVKANGNVSFRTRYGRGCGAATEIPSNQFDEFVSFMIKAREVRKDLATQQAALENQEEEKSE